MKILQNNSFSTNFGGNWVTPCLFFLLSAATAGTYIFTALTYTTIIISLKTSALNAEF
jgi:hypothetical protein